MLLSLALIFLCGMTLGNLFSRCKLPPLLGMMVTGILLGPYVLGLLDRSILDISPELRKIALIIILTRAGLNLDLDDLKKVGRPAVLMCFLPASMEILGMVLLAPKLLGLSMLEAALLGSVVAAVSPAVVVPKMLKLMQEGYGKKHSIPPLIMAGASVDDVFVIVLFTSFTGLVSGSGVNSVSFLRMPISILLGIAGGALCGLLLAFFFRRVHLRDSGKVIIFLSISCLFVVLEQYSFGIFSFSGLIAVMAMGIFFQRSRKEVASRLSAKYEKLWVAAEPLLFVLVGATVDIRYTIASGLSALLLLALVLLFRMFGVFLCVFATDLSRKEKLFCMIAYCPKATVQAAIGPIPLSLGLACGNMVLSVAVLAILLTAPLGAFAIDLLYPKLLDQEVAPAGIEGAEGSP